MYYSSPEDRIKPVLFFPPGYYVVHQPQVPSTSSPLSVPCYLEMEGAYTPGGAAFATMAHGSQIAHFMGPNPNAAATITYNIAGPILRHMTIIGAIMFLALYGVAPSEFEDVCLSSQVTGLPDRTPLKVTDSFWVWYKG